MDNSNLNQESQSLLEIMVKHLINDLNRLLDTKNESIESEVKLQRRLLLNILLENNHDLDHTKAKKVIEYSFTIVFVQYHLGFSPWSKSLLR
jgi:hypothetical protein